MEERLNADYKGPINDKYGLITLNVALEFIKGKVAYTKEIMMCWWRQLWNIHQLIDKTENEFNCWDSLLTLIG